MHDVRFKKVISSSLYFNVVCSLNEQVCKDTTNEANNKCPWILFTRAGKKSCRKFKITTISNKYTRSNTIIQCDHPQAKNNFICSIIMPIVKTKFDLFPIEMKDQMWYAYIIGVF